MRWLRRVIVLGLMGLSVAARATEPPAARARVVLGYGRSGTAVKACPDEATFRALVAARLGYDAFVDGSTSERALTLRVEFRPRGALVFGTLALTDHGAAKGDRTITAAPADCYELGASLALAAAVAVDPEGALAQKTAPPGHLPPSPGQTPPPSGQTPPSSGQASPSFGQASPSSGQAPPLSGQAAPPSEQAPPSSGQAPPSSPSSITPPPTSSEPALPVAEKSTLSGSLDAGAVVSVGMQPGPAPGVRLGGALASGRWSLGLEMVAFLPSERTQTFGTASAHALYGSLLPCLHPGSTRLTVDVCAVMSVGALFSDGSGVTRSRPVTDRYATAGARVGLTLRASDSIAFALDAEAPVLLSRVHLLVDDAGVKREVWAAGRVGFIGGARVVMTLH